MGFHSVDLLCFSVEINGLTMLSFAARAGLFFFVWPLRGVLFRVNFK